MEEPSAIAKTLEVDKEGLSCLLFCSSECCVILSLLSIWIVLFFRFYDK